MTAEADGDAEARIARLERRIRRERDAREQAERIAERGMRDLWQTNRGLEQRVVERTRELHQSLASARMAAEAKEAFLAELGHELTTPLHAVLGLLELIDAEPLSAQDRQRLGQVAGHAGTLSELLFGLVELANAHGATHPGDAEEMLPSAWLDAIAERWTLPAAVKGLLVVPSVSGETGPVRLDWSRLQRISESVLNNVIDHGVPGPVNITLTVENAAVRLDVRDPGPGMTSEQIETAIEPFVKHGDAGGVGIGLAVAHRLADSGGGHLDIEVAAEGTRVSVTLPRIA